MQLAAWLLPLSMMAMCASSPAQSEEPAGIVMEISGETTPPLSAMSEIPGNVAIQLQPDTTLTFLHYARCELVTVTGGTLTLTRAGYHQEGKIDKEADGPCPHIHSLAGEQGHSTVGFLSRGPSAVPLWPANMEIILTGTRADAVTALEIRTKGQPKQPPLPLVLAGLRAREPQGTPSLQSGGHYILRVTLRDRAVPVNTPFIATVPSPTGALVVLRVD
jgi:hypothetical protein